ncbi:MAG TPA: NAD-dependent epimerase/dehydratase family protein [Chitinophagaceae bacterium]|nr:NAD-dependent epimerase/dehydratase family protein [Chitinophagaceae bacterium]
MKILITGITGFLGSAVKRTLSAGHEITGLARSQAADIPCDLAKEVPRIPACDMVLHCAGMAHRVPRTPEEEAQFFSLNVTGTKNLLGGIEQSGSLPQTFVFISSVAVYGLEEGIDITEEAALLGKSAYARSKIEAEQYIQEWCKVHNVHCVILRLPLITGWNAPGNLGAMQKAIKKGYYFRLGEGNSRRSMVSAVDLARFIPSVAGKDGVYNLTSGIHYSYAELEAQYARHYGKKIKAIPHGLARFAARIGDFIPGFPLNTYRYMKLAQTLTFSDAKARRELNWNAHGLTELNSKTDAEHEK